MLTRRKVLYRAIYFILLSTTIDFYDDFTYTHLQILINEKYINCKKVDTYSAGLYFLNSYKDSIPKNNACCDLIQTFLGSISSTIYQ